MTEKANPSPNRPVDAFKTAGAIAYSGSVSGFIVDASSPTDISSQDSDITEGNFNNFSESSSSNSLTVSIDGGEAFVFGSWLAIDTTTNVDLNASTTDQTVYLGWDKNTSNDVIIGLDSAFSSAITDTDQKIPLYDFDTDGSGVTSVTDKRQIGRSQELNTLAIASELGIPLYSDSSNAPQSEGNIIAIDGNASQNVGIYYHNGTSYTKSGKTSEEVEDVVNQLLVGGTAIGISYDDANDTLTINNKEPYTDEDAEDAVSNLINGGTNVSTTYDDPNSTLTIDTSALDAEEVDDRVNDTLSAGNNINISYDDANDAITINTSALTEEEVEDAVNDLLSTSGNLNLTYDDVNNDLQISLTSTITADTVDVSSELGAPVYQSTSDVPSVPEGTIVYIQDDNALYVEDGT